jgi:hypothetical protein
MALAQFLFTYIDKASRDSIKHVLTNEQDGIELMLYMHKHYGATNMTDAYKAKETLEATSWETSNTIDMFNSRFMKCLATYHTTLSTAINTKGANKLNPDELVQLYLTRLVTTMPRTNSLYTRVRDEFITVQSDVDSNSPTSSTLSTLTPSMQKKQPTIKKLTQSPSTSTITRKTASHTPFYTNVWDTGMPQHLP